MCFHEICVCETFVCSSPHRFTETKTGRKEKGAEPSGLEEKLHLHPEAALLLLLRQRHADVSRRDDAAPYLQ